MAYERKDGEGVLFTNDNRANDRHPDYKGEVKIGGKTYSIAAWKRKTSKGDDYFSLKVEEPFVPKAAEKPEDDGDMPF